MPVSTIGAPGLARPLGVGGISNPVYDLHVLRADGASGTLSLSGPTATGGPSYVIMGNNDSAGVSGPNVIVAANRTLQFGVGTSFTAAGAGTFTSYMNIDPNGRVTKPVQPHIFGTPGRTTSADSGIMTNFTALSARGGLSGGSDRITVPVAGLYMIFFQTILTSGSGRVDTNILINGATRSNGLNDTNTTGFRMRTHAITTLLQAGDFVQFNSGAWYVGGGTFDQWQVASIDLIA
jgi:hypothetical protein